jgi:ammonia channel protein AmtB
MKFIRFFLYTILIFIFLYPPTYTIYYEKYYAPASRSLDDSIL